MTTAGQAGPGEPDGAWSAAQRRGFDQAPIILLVFEGLALRLTAVNRVASGVVGERPLGTPMREVFADLDAQQVVEMYENCFATGATQQFEEWRVQYEDPAGGVGESYFDYTVAATMDEDGTITGVIGMGQDVTARVRSRRAFEAALDEAAPGLAGAQQVVRTMQDAHLPLALPVLPCLDVSARYLLATEDTAAGGDWFDVVVRPDGSTALTVGDVVGHGTIASAIMGQLRAVCHERLTSPAPLEDVLADVDRFSRTAPEARHATLCIVELDPATGQGRYCTAGHPPPLLVDGDAPRFLPSTGAGPLGTSGTFPIAPFRLEAPDALVILYTDGLIERPGREPASSTVELAGTVHAVVEGRGALHGAADRLTERVCDIVLEQMTRLTGYGDDISIVAAQRSAAPAPLRLEVAAERAAVADVRHQCGRWLERLAIDATDRVAITHAISELAANTAEHAYHGVAEPGRISVEVELASDGELRLEVTDQGRWRQPPDPDGRGLLLAHALLDSLTIESDAGGTRAIGGLRPARQARLMVGRSLGIPADHRNGSRDDTFAIHQHPGRLDVTGPVLADDADELYHRVRQLAAAGAPTVIDLGAVTHLGSAAVRVLHDLTERHRDITILAPYGSVAQHVLALVELPHQTAEVPVDGAGGGETSRDSP